MFWLLGLWRVYVMGTGSARSDVEGSEVSALSL